MNTLAMFAATSVALPAAGGLLGLLFWVAVFAVIVVAVVAIIRHMGIAIPPVVVIVFWALLSIALIILLFRLFGVLV